MKNYLSGVCKKEYKKKMQRFKDVPFDMPEEEFGYEKGDYMYVGLREDCHWYEDKSLHVYEVRVHHQTFELSREEIEELVEIKYEYKHFNSCIQEGVPCQNLRGFSEGNTAISPQTHQVSCGIRWEVGRAACSRYEK